jgi:glycerol-3-phosphate dehydrogenase (NAD(P)+)
MSRDTNIGVIGGGAWGTALAQTAASVGNRVTIWAREPEVVRDIEEHHRNELFLPGVTLDAGLHATADLDEVASLETILLVAPAQHLRAVAGHLAGKLRPGATLVVCAKGLEQSTGTLMGQVLAETVPAARLAILSGPSFAADVARGLPTAVTLAADEQSHGRALAEQLSGRNFRIYWTDDLIGTQLGGAVKNVLAIAAGIVDGRGLGASAHAALVTRGFAELRRFSEAMGARTETLMGLSGLGDLLLTCGSPQSRNMSLGRALGQGSSLDEYLGSRRSVAEGVYTAAAVVRRAAELGVEMPIASAVHAIVDGKLTVDAAIEALLSRPLKPET